MITRSGYSFNFKKAVIFIDGTNFFCGIDDYQKGTKNTYKVDYPQLKEMLRSNATIFPLDFLEIIKTYYYGPKGVPEELKSIKGRTISPKEIEEFIEKLRHYHAKVVLREKINKKEKGVDIAFATDILSLAYTGAYDYAILVSGDADFIPVIDEIKRYGKMVCVASFKSRYNEALQEHIDQLIFLDAENKFLRKQNI